MGSSLNWWSLLGFFYNCAVLYLGFKRDPNLENYPYGFLGCGGLSKESYKEKEVSKI